MSTHFAYVFNIYLIIRLIYKSFMHIYARNLHIYKFFPIFLLFSAPDPSQKTPQIFKFSAKFSSKFAPFHMITPPFPLRLRSPAPAFYSYSLGFLTFDCIAAQNFGRHSNSICPNTHPIFCSNIKKYDF